jgi:hypothetical protein
MECLHGSARSLFQMLGSTRDHIGAFVFKFSWSPMSSSKSRGFCCRTTGDNWAPLLPGGAAWGFLRALGGGGGF